MRTINLTAPDFVTLETPKPTTWELTLKTITPMFGGSAKTREVDSENPVRPSSVRGHLRFWWRATAGAGFSSAKDLFDAEEKLWGSAEKYGKVSLRVSQKPARLMKYSDFVQGFGDARSYALFPFAKNRGVEEANCLVDLEFILTLTFPQEYQKQIHDAVAAWINFGGIGSRTRRGCGSLEASSKLTVQAKEHIEHSLLTFLPKQYLIGTIQNNPMIAWKQSLEIYRDFRQGIPFARENGSDPTNSKKAGRSRYPEPDTIRRLSPSPKAKWTHQPRHVVKGFPRADLGLPIIFQFIGEGEIHTLEGFAEKQTRFASPVITKVIKVDKGYAPILMILDAPNVWQNGDLIINKNKVSQTQIELTEDERKNVPPMNGLSIRKALIEFAESESRGFKKESL